MAGRKPRGPHVNPKPPKRRPRPKRRIRFISDPRRLTGARLRSRMSDGGDLAPMTGIANFTSGTVVITVAVANASDRENYELYGASANATPSANTNSVASSDSQPTDDLLEGSKAYTAGATFTIQLTFNRDVPNAPTIVLSATITNPVGEQPFTLS